MGLRGPAPKRREDKMGHYHTAQEPIDEIVVEEELRKLAPGVAWTEPARFAYQAFLDSPLAQFYTNTDVIVGWMAAHAIDEAIKNPTATKILAAESLMTTALFAESDRRRIRVELTRKEPETRPDIVQNVTDFQARRRERGAS